MFSQSWRLPYINIIDTRNSSYQFLVGFAITGRSLEYRFLGPFNHVLDTDE